MADDIKRQADMMRATSQVLEIMAPFTPEERLNIIAGAALFGGVGDLIFDTASPAVKELLKKVKPGSNR